MDARCVMRMVGQLSNTVGAVSLSFVRYRSGEVMFVSGADGLRSYDLRDRDRPRLLDHLTKSELALPGDDAGQPFLQNAAMGTGHTTTCINRCSYLWTAGYDGIPDNDPDAYQRSGKIFVTDIRDPARPRTSTTYVDLGRHQGRTRMTHDVQVDARGVAWVAGTGGTRGYHTAGWHRDPLTG